MTTRWLALGLVLAALPTDAHTQVPLSAPRSGDASSLKDYVNVELGVDLFGLGVSRSVWRAREIDPAFTVRGIASTWGGYLVEALAEKNLGRPELSGAVYVRGSTIERNRFYGFGNQTDATQPSRFYRLEQLHFEAGAALTVGLPGAGNRLSVGPFFQQIWTENDALDGHADDNPGELDDGGIIQLLRPYGRGSFQQFGLEAALSVGSSGPESGSVTGLRLDIGTRVFPAWLDMRSPGVITAADLRAFVLVPAPLDPALFVRASVDRVFGDAPFHESAFLGGRRSLRGFQKQRFAGDLSLAINSELRLNAWQFGVAGRQIQGGPSAVFDVGRVYVDGVSNGGWHVGAGGGIWLRDAASGRIVSAAVVRSAEGLRTYVAVGFPFWH